MSQDVDHVLGDVTDPVSVATALAGCDAVVHAAAVYRFDARFSSEAAHTKVVGAESVLRAAAKHGCDPIVHVSSSVALLLRRATVTPEVRPRAVWYGYPSGYTVPLGRAEGLAHREPSKLASRPRAGPCRQTRSCSLAGP